MISRFSVKLIFPLFFAVLFLCLPGGWTLLGQETGNAPFVISQSLPNGKVKAFAQDSDGFIWMGTMHGVSRYNGNSFRTYFASREKHSLVSDNIYDMCFDSSGDLWVTTECGFAVLRNGGFLNTEHPYEYPIYRVMQMNESNMVLFCRDGILKISKEDLTVKANYFSPGIERSTAIDVSIEGEVWFIDNRGDGGKPFIKVLDRDMSLRDSILLPMDGEYFSIKCNEDNSVWVSDGNGIIQFNGWTMRREENAPALSLLLGQGRVLSISGYGDGQVLLALEGNGYFVYDLYRRTVERIAVGFSPEKENSVCFVDSRKNIWLSDSEGFRFVPVENGIARTDLGETIDGESLRSLCCDDEGYVWFCSEKEFASMNVATGRIAWRKKQSSTQNRLTIDGEGYLWMVNDFNKIVKCSISGGVPTVVESYSFPSSVLSLCPKPEGGIFAALILSPFSIGKDGTVESVEVDNKQEESFYTGVFEDSYGGGAYLVGMIDSTFFYDGKSFSSLGLKGIKGVSSILELDGKRWIGTLRDGLFLQDLSSGEVSWFGIGAGLAEDSIRSIVRDHSGNIWVATPSLIYRYDSSSGRFLPLSGTFGSRWSYYDSSLADVSSSGLLVFGGGMEVTFINPSIAVGGGESLPLYFDSVSVNDEQMTSIPDEILLHPRQRVITFNYSTLNYDAGSSVNYYSFLEGFDKEWNKVGQTGKSTYTNLRPGKYVLHVKAGILDSPWVDGEITKTLRVRHSFFNSIPFRIAVLVLLFTLFALIYQQVRKMRQQKEHLRLSVERENNKQLQIDRMAGLSSRIKASTASIAESVSGLRRSPYLRGEERILIEGMSRYVEEIDSLLTGSLTGTVPAEEEAIESFLKKENDLSGAAESSSGKEMSLRERNFLLKLSTVMDAHLDDSDFNIDVMAAEMNMSRSTLFKKVKALTGDSPVSYIKSYRMNEAMERLRSGKCTVGEVAIDVGSSSVSNFSRDFKNYFGVTPSSVSDGMS